MAKDNGHDDRVDDIAVKSQELREIHLARQHS
jgi:hypothetical protein